MWLQAALSLAAWVSAAVADDSKDLGSVLAANKNLTKFYELIKVPTAPVWSVEPCLWRLTFLYRNTQTSCWSCRVTMA